MTTPQVTLTEERLQQLATDALVGLGLTREDAHDAALILVMADLFGLHTHGVSRIESYGERLRMAGIKARPSITVEQVAPTMLRVDGDNGVGTLVGYRALQAAMTAAKAHGMAIAFVRGSNHFGPISPYSYLAAQAGFASMVCSNATTTIAPWGGTDARLGNSPLGYGVPRPGGEPVFVDMAMSVVARAKIRNAAKAGQSIPNTWGTDKAGRPTTDPQAALDGFLLPIGGHKGYGLALIVDLFAGLLSGAAYLTHVKSWVDDPELPQNIGHFFFLFDTARLGPSAWLADRMADFASILHDSPPVDPKAPVLVPGEIETRKMAQHRTHGIPIDAPLVELMEKLKAEAAH
jgi:LDH2 family malate/lactate/ureidoglycolate dehydrogenase